MLARYVWRELVRNPRRSLAALVGVMLGVGLFSGVLFFVDGSGASMTSRALAPLALDMQRVLTAPLGGGLALGERLSDRGPLRRGQTTRITLTVTNSGTVPVNEVVVGDEPPAPLAYVHGTTTLNGKALHDERGRSPLAQGLARTGLNVGTLAAGTTLRLSYLARAGRAVAAAASPQPRGTVSSRENVVPARANAPAALGLGQLAARVARLPGVAAADGLAFVDLPPGSLRAGGASVSGPVRIFGFQRRYLAHYPSIGVVSGAPRPGAAMLSAEASHALAAGPGATVGLRVPGRRGALPLPVSGVTDLSHARPLFYSRKASELEAFLYVPNSVVVDLATFEHTIVPAFRAASAARGSAPKSLPLLELDVLVERGLLHSDPGRALAQTQAIARSIHRVAPAQDYLIDNISNTLQVARDDAAVAKRMFLFLGLPGALLAAFLAAYAGSVLAGAQRREQANLRIRGAHRGHLRRMLVYRTGALAGAGSVLGTVLGLASTLAILGSDTLFTAAAAQLVVSALVSVAVGMLTTGVALYVPGRRSLSREIGHERAELATAGVPAWRRRKLDLLALAAVAVASVIALRGGAFDAPPGSVYAGRAVSLPSHLLLAPVAVWIAGILLAVRAFAVVASRIGSRRRARFGSPVRGTLGRTVGRRAWAVGGGVAATGLVVAFGTSLAVFAGTYDAAKAADARFVVGSDLRVTPSVLDSRPHPSSFATELQVPGVAAATPVVFEPGNAVLSGPYTEDRADLAAVDPASFDRVAALSDSVFAGGSAAGAMAALRRDPRAVLIDTRTADDFQIGTGDRVRVLLARGTKQQRLVKLHVVGRFDHFPGFPQGTDLVANLHGYQAATGTTAADFFLARTSGHGHAGLARAVASLRAGPGRREPLDIATTATALDKDQSSLTALNVHGLVALDSLYTLLMTAAGIGIFVFGLILQRRREYVALRAQGMETREIQSLVLGETGIVGVCGLAAGIGVGMVMAFLLVHILRPLFVLDPGFAVPAREVSTLAALAVAATLLSSLTATATLRRLRPTEILREA